jgi:hypothetical protein
LHGLGGEFLVQQEDGREVSIAVAPALTESITHGGVDRRHLRHDGCMHRGVRLAYQGRQVVLQG